MNPSHAPADATDAELVAAIDRGLDDGSLVAVDDVLLDRLSALAEEKQL